MGRIGKTIVTLAILVIAGSLLVPVVYFARLVGRGRTVEREIDLIRQRGEPVSREDLLGKPIPDSENAAIIYAKCFEAIPQSSNWYGGGFGRQDRQNEDAEYWDGVRARLRHYSNALALAEKAAAMPKCKYPPEPERAKRSMMTGSRGVRTVARAAAAKAQLEARDGRPDGALRYLKLAYRVADSLAHERDNLRQRIRLSAIVSASRAFSASASFVRFSEEQAGELAAVIDSVDLSNAARYSLQGHRVMGLTIYDSVSKGEVPVMEAENASMNKAFKRMCSSLPGRTWLYSDQLYYLKEMKRHIDDADLPYRIVHANASRPRPEPPRYVLFATLLLMRTDELSREVDRAKAGLAGSRIMLGIMAYRDRFGSYPPSLDVLRERLHWSTPEDPFSGKSFGYRREGRGFVLYSIGDDLRDNGGHHEDSTNPDMTWVLDR